MLAQNLTITTPTTVARTMPFQYIFESDRYFESRHREYEYIVSHTQIQQVAYDWLTTSNGKREHTHFMQWIINDRNFHDNYDIFSIFKFYLKICHSHVHSCSCVCVCVCFNKAVGSTVGVGCDFEIVYSFQFCRSPPLIFIPFGLPLSHWMSEVETWSCSSNSTFQRSFNQMTGKP